MLHAIFQFPKLRGTVLRVIYRDCYSMGTSETSVKFLFSILAAHTLSVIYFNVRRKHFFTRQMSRRLSLDFFFQHHIYLQFTFTRLLPLQTRNNKIVPRPKNLYRFLKTCILYIFIKSKKSQKNLYRFLKTCRGFFYIFLYIFIKKI